MLEPNKYMTWEEAVKEYPNSWVIFDENAKDDWGGEPLEGNVIAVCNNDEIDDYLIECYKGKKNVYYDRTCYKMWAGIINAPGIALEVN